MRVLLVVAAVMAAAVLIYTGVSVSGRDAAAGANPAAMDAMSIDMDPSGNSGTSNGDRDFCARINENDIMDADEEAVDTVEVDVTALNIPVGSSAIGTNFNLLFPAPDQFLVSQQFSTGTPFATANGWNIFNVSDPV
jgi:hypothetical protein